MDKTKLIIGVLILIILSFVIYSFAIKSQKTDEFNQGYDTAIALIIQQAAQCQPVPLSLGNQTINVIGVNCIPMQVDAER